MVPNEIRAFRVGRTWSHESHCPRRSLLLRETFTCSFPLHLKTKRKSALSMRAGFPHPSPGTTKKETRILSRLSRKMSKKHHTKIKGSIKQTTLFFALVAVCLPVRIKGRWVFLRNEVEQWNGSLYREISSICLVRLGGKTINSRGELG